MSSQARAKIVQRRSHIQTIQDASSNSGTIESKARPSEPCQAMEDAKRQRAEEEMRMEAAGRPGDVSPHWKRGSVGSAANAGSLSFNYPGP